MPLHQERSRSGLIYVVDDEAIIASTLAEIIKIHGFDARHFTNSREALEAARLLAPDILLSDLLMPEMTGLELALQVSQLRPECKMILLSGQTGTADLLERAREGGLRIEVLTKPLHPKTLVENVKRLLFTPAAAAND